MRPLWADATGLPTKHAVSAAYRVADLIDPAGSHVGDARETYWRVATGGLLPPADLAIGEALLLDVGLAVQIEGVLHRTEHLDELMTSDADFFASAALLGAAELIGSFSNPPNLAEFRTRVAECVDDEGHGDETATVVVAKFDDALRKLVGDIGEEHVVTEARRELWDAGHERLARAVRHVSRVSDAYGYDVAAPRVNGPDRLLEVKTTTQVIDTGASIFISRHEAEVGSRNPSWALVVCEVQDIALRQARTVGWLPYRDIEPHLPHDADSGRWESASLRLPLDSVSDGIPSAFL